MEEREVGKEAASCRENGKIKGIVKVLVWISKYDFHADHKTNKQTNKQKT